jgi:predicted Zn finger-like uncharacterized protein
MILSCPNCKTGFFVAPEQIGEAGRRVKCSKCKNIWLAMIDPAQLIKDEVIAKRLHDHKTVTGANLPAIIPIKIHSLQYALPPFLLFMILITIWMFYPTITSKIGINGPLHNYSSLRIEDIIHDYNKISKQITVEYSVANRGEDKIEVPYVELKLLDDKNTILRTLLANGGGIEISPNQSVRVKNSFNLVDNSSKFVQITLGKRSKFWLR